MRRPPRSPLFPSTTLFYSADVPEGKIMTQMPAPGAKVRRGWSIRVAQSLGLQRVAIPDVTGESERAAELNIRRRGLALGSVAQVSLPRSEEHTSELQSLRHLVCR